MVEAIAQITMDAAAVVAAVVVVVIALEATAQEATVPDITDNKKSL